MPRQLEERSAQHRIQSQLRQQLRQEKPRSPWWSLVTAAQIAVGLAAYIAVLGFIVNLGLLRQSTTLVPLKIVPLTYLSLGISFIATLLIVVIPYVVAFLAALYLIGVLIWGIRDKRFQPIRAFRVFIQILWELVVSEKMVIVGMIAFLFASASAPGAMISRLPSVQSTTQNLRGILLIFKEPIDTTLWPLSVDPQNDRRTQRLNLIAELEDGLLVRDAATGVVVEVKNDAINGLIDNSSLQPAATTTSPAPTATIGP